MTLPINPKLGDTIADSIKNLKDQRAKEGKVLGKHEVGALIQAAIVGEFARISEKPKPPTAKKPAPLPDDQWITELEANPAYAGIDVKRELGKAQVWAGTRGEAVTRRRFVAWLNKVERPVAMNGVGRSSFPVAVNGQLPEPPKWREWVRANASDPSIADRAWSSLDLTSQRYITSQMKL